MWAKQCLLSAAPGTPKTVHSMAGRGQRNFCFWGRRSANRPVRILIGSDVTILIGLQFQLQFGFAVDMRRLRRSFMLGGYLNEGQMYEVDLFSSDKRPSERCWRTRLWA